VYLFTHNRVRLVGNKTTYRCKGAVPNESKWPFVYFVRKVVMKVLWREGVGVLIGVRKLFGSDSVAVFKCWWKSRLGWCMVVLLA